MICVDLMILNMNYHLYFSMIFAKKFVYNVCVDQFS